MEIEEGMKIKTEKRFEPVEIPDVSRDDLPAFFVRQGYKVGVEIGVDRGEYTEKLCQAGLQVYGVDPWKLYDDYLYQAGQGALDANYEKTKKRLADYDCKLLKTTSMGALDYFEDESLDFVYIDGHHGFRYVAEDLWEWNKKVKVGGVISGHDYALNTKPPYHPYTLHVKWVLRAFVRSLKIEDWYVLGRYETKEGEKRDRWRSWFWIKPESYKVEGVHV